MNILLADEWEQFRLHMVPMLKTVPGVEKIIKAKQIQESEIK